MTKSLAAVRGMKDILPAEQAAWSWLEGSIRALVATHGYQECRTPIIEKTALFSRSIGQATDIVEKEMYTFEDRNGDSLSLRPEGTAGCARAGIEHGLFYNQTQRLWYMGPMFRHERPQAGRYRQFYQLGIEAVGFTGPDIDAELIVMMNRLWNQLGLSKHVELQLNSLGSAATRANHREALVSYFTAHHADLDEDSQRRLTMNPLRILDSKNPQMQALIQGAPKLPDFFDKETTDHFDGVVRLLEAAKVPYVLNPRLVRGLDYYDFTVFEWVTTELGAQGTVCAGGRYNGLIAQLGGQSTPAVGLAMGLERVIALLNQFELTPPSPQIVVYWVGPEQPEDIAGSTATLQAIEACRSAVPSVCIIQHCGAGRLKNQLKRADKANAAYAVIPSEESTSKSPEYVLKDLKSGEQQVFSQNDLIQHLKKLNSKG